MSNAFDKINERGFVHQCTDIDEVKRLLGNKKTVFYLGIDPTANSLHIGHFFALRMFKILQDFGHKGILVIGGATAMIGDPTGKENMRKMLSKDEIDYNIKEVSTLAERFIKTDGNNPAIILNNNDWISKFSYVDFLRTIGRHFPINQMITAESYSKRLKNGGLNYLEMGYMPMQAYDFFHLNNKYNCALQIGGSDQWGNIVAGTMLNRKIRFSEELKPSEVFGLTCPLLTTKEGHKMGKTEKGTLWVARDKTAPYDFFQYFYNVSDDDVETLLRFFTDKNINDIKKACKDNIVAAKKEMAYEITALVHGEQEAIKVTEASKKIFNKKFAGEGAPIIKLTNHEVKNLEITDILIRCGLVKSKGEARRLIDQKGLEVENEKINDYHYKINELIQSKDRILIKKGKKNIVQVELTV